MLIGPGLLILFIYLAFENSTALKHTASLAILQIRYMLLFIIYYYYCIIYLHINVTKTYPLYLPSLILSWNKTKKKNQLHL